MMCTCLHVVSMFLIFHTFGCVFFLIFTLLKLQGSTNLESIQIIKKPGGSLKDSFLDEGWVLVLVLFLVY